MASIDRRNGQYRVRWRDPDGTARSRQVRDFTTARKLLRDVERTVGEGRRWEPRDARPLPDVEQIMTAFTQRCVRVLARGTAVVYGRYLVVFVRWLREREGQRARLYPELLSKQTLEDFHAWLRSTGRHGKPRAVITANKYIERVHDAWQWAFEDDEFGPYVPRPKAIELPTVEYKPIVAPTWAEMDAAIDKTKGWYRRLLLAQRFLGLRVNQVMRLRFDDFDLDRGVLRFRGELGKTKHEKRGRVFPVSPHFIEEVRGWGKHDGFLIDSGRSAGPRERVARSREVSRAWRKAGVREEVWLGRPDHAFRKGFVSELTRAGASVDAVEFLVGHSLGLMRDTYTDPEALALRAAVTLIPRFGQHQKILRLAVPA